MRLFTLGYEGLTPARFLDVLAAADARAVIDVRALANSRRPGFAKRALTASLHGAGLGYAHLRALGTPVAGRAAVRAGRPAEMRRVFAAHLKRGEAQAALADLALRAREGPLCLLCLEHDPAHCHRTLVAEAVAGMVPGLEVVALTP